jgi:hypothetical protein
LANILYIRQLALWRPDLECFSLHPGAVKTEIGRDYAERKGLFGKFLKFMVFTLFGWLFKSPDQGIFQIVAVFYLFRICDIFILFISLNFFLFEE